MRQRALFGLIAAAGFAACGGSAPAPTSPSTSLAFPGSAGSSAAGSVESLVGAGDIALCGSKATEATARLLDTLPGTVFAAGDNAYPNGTADDYKNCYDPTWGRVKSRTRPVPGNHDYDSPGAQPYYDYFGAAAGPSGLGYYSYRLGEWQIYALNSNIATESASVQVQWLQQDLAAHPTTCALAYWHYPLFTSGPHGDQVSMRPLWRVLYDADAEIVISAHDHLYERFAPQDPDGRPDPVRGIREFIVGTGGAELTGPVTVHPNSDARWTVNGVLQLILRPDSYLWTFMTETGATADLGSGSCHTRPRTQSLFLELRSIWLRPLARAFPRLGASS